MIRLVNNAWRALWSSSPIRYLATGSFLFLIDLAVFMTLKSLGVSTVAAQAVSRTIGATIGFAGHKLFSFKNKEKNAAALTIQGTSYAICTIANIVISPVVVLAFEHLVPTNLILVKVFAEMVMIVETYIVLRWIFGKQTTGRGASK